MNYNMYTNQRNDNIDPNYIYPQPYIDPIMYMNPFAMNKEALQNYNNNMNQMDYTTYSNPYVDNPQAYSNKEDNTTDNTYSTESNMNKNINNPPSGIPVMPPNMMFPGMMPYMMNIMPPNMMPNMLYPGMMIPPSMMPNMMYPNMMPNMPTVNMEEFDEEEM